MRDTLREPVGSLFLCEKYNIEIGVHVPLRFVYRGFRVAGHFLVKSSPTECMECQYPQTRSKVMNDKG